MTMYLLGYTFHCIHHDIPPPPLPLFLQPEKALYLWSPARLGPNWWCILGVGVITVGIDLYNSSVSFVLFEAYFLTHISLRIWARLFKRQLVANILSFLGLTKWKFFAENLAYLISFGLKDLLFRWSLNKIMQFVGQQDIGKKIG